MLGQKNLFLKPCQHLDILIKHFFIQGVFMISAFLFRFNKTRIHQDLYMVRNRRLSQVHHILYIGTLPASTLVGYVMKDLYTISIA